ncbi:MAG: hypothetical protein E7249_01855 [Paenibacillaceae bacterium]|nr:hypothetical protein [Paenibacillaceae bacterium]
MYEQEFQRIVDASRNHSLTFFVGAGVSALSGAPSWKKLIQEICYRLKRPIKEAYSSDENLQIPQMYYYSIEKDDDTYYSFIEELLTTNNLLPNEVHKELLNFNPSSFITTNFDSLIEEAAIQYCQSFKVVACDDEVSSINGDRYILKLHGDLKHKNIVFKEEDYLNYSENFKLTETLLKSIFSTNTVVFIGYGLNDYNIKLILNWAKTLLKDHFNKPIFIYTGETPLSTEELLYQKSKGLCVIECEKIVKHSTDYFTRYMSVLMAIKKSSDLSIDGKTEQEAFGILYELLEPLDRLNTLRIRDVYSKLKPYIRINDDGTILTSPSESILIQYFFKINMISVEEYESIPKAIQEKYQVILRVFSKAQIDKVDIEHKRHFFANKEVYFADPNCIGFNYENMFAFASKKYTTIRDNYKKGFYLARLKQYDKAFYMFAQIANQAFKSKDYLFYYLAEVNCINLRIILRNVNQYYNCYDIEKIDATAPNTDDIEHLFEKLPIEFQNQYISFKDIHSTNLLYQYSYEAFADGQKLRNAIESNSIEYGFTSSAKAMCRINDYLHFLLGNGIVVDLFAEFKNTINNLMSLLVYKYSVQGKKNLQDEFFLGSTQEEVYFDEIDFYCFVECFSSNELIQLFSKHKVKTITFQKIDLVENAINNMLKYYEQLIKKNASFTEIINLQRQIKSCLALLRYVDISQSLVETLCRFLFKYEFREILINDKISFLYYQLLCKEMYSDVTSKIIEDKLLFYIDSQIRAIESSEKFNEPLSNSGLTYSNLIHYVAPKNEQYHSRRVAIRVLYIIKNNMTDMVPHVLKDYWNHISPYSRYKVTTWVKEKLTYSFNFDMFTLLIECNVKIDKKLIESLIGYLRDIIQKESIESKKTEIFTHSERDLYRELKLVGYWCLIKKLRKDDFKAFVGVNDFFDFFYQYEKFDFTKFDVSWLLNLNLQALKAIANNKLVKEKIRFSIVHVLDEGNVLDTDKMKLLDILTHHFC